MRTLIFATRNSGKTEELQKLVSDLNFSVKDLNSFREAPVVEETGTTFAENALLKARETVKWSGRTALADDSGLEVDILSGQPGIYSSRFAGEDASDEDNNRKLIKLVRDYPLEERTARFCCVLALVTPEGQEQIVEGSCEGLIVQEPKGEHGFGYDPIFYLPDYQATFAQLGEKIKNRISHRARAFLKMREIIRDLLYEEII